MTLDDTGRKATSAEGVSSAGARMVDRAQKSVVQVQSRGRGGAGAGVIWDADGLVLTNHHVVATGRRDGRVGVILHDDLALEAEVVKRGRDLDLALLRIKGAPDDLPVSPVGDSDMLRVGELVYAIGHPWGRLGAVTAGIVSGLGSARGRGGRARYVESDIALAPGNSGGPLLNARGEVVGINAMIYGNLALSIPSNAAGAWVAGAGGRRPRLGVALLPADLPASLRGADVVTGLVIAAVKEDSPAGQAGLLVGDVLVGVGDEPLDGFDSLLDALAGDSVRLRVMRGGKISFVEVNFGASGRAA